VSGSLAQKMAGEIVFSENPGETLKKWREIFGLTQKEMADLLEINPSVVCDFEKGRRDSPGIKTVKRMVDTMILYDENNGNKVINSRMDEKEEEPMTIGEFSSGISVKKLMEMVNGEIIVGKREMNRTLYGFTIVDSLKAIISFSGSEFAKIYGWSNERALFFTGVEFGRSPMIAIRAHPVKPRLVCYVQPGSIDPLAIKLAELENIILVRTDNSIENIKNLMRGFG
tara:strand:+ start:1271 stop:1951 length:681 start_codon:yes stop_codon:yes gene_type:complete